VNSFTFKLSPILLAIVGGAALSVNGFAADVYLSDFDKLNNGGFEQGNQAIKPGDTAACPLGWICGGSPSPGATAYQPTALEFPAASNGLFQPPSGGPRINPSGSWSALCPTLIEGSCILSQAKIGGLKYAAGTTYHLSLWLGTPKVMPFDRYGNVDDKTPLGELSGSPSIGSVMETGNCTPLTWRLPLPACGSITLLPSRPLALTLGKTSE
jgi:hypothetical protein